MQIFYWISDQYQSDLSRYEYWYDVKMTGDITPDEMIENLTEEPDEIPLYTGASELIDALREEHPNGGEPRGDPEDYEPREDEEFTYQAAESILASTLWHCDHENRDSHEEVLEQARSGQYDEVEAYLEDMM